MPLGKQDESRDKRTALGIVRLALALWIVASLAWAPGLAGQTKQTPTAANYINPGLIPSAARSFLFAFGDRLQRSGKERVSLTGKYADLGGTVDLTLTWEVPGRFRLDRSDRPQSPFIYDEINGWNNLAAISLQEADALESLFDDRPESFFYGILHSPGQRFLGNGFRSDNGKTSNYKGPWYDVYEAITPVHSPQSVATRRKVYFFDSQTKLLNKVEYTTRGSVKVSTEMSSWAIVQGQALPQSVVRRENGAVVVSVNFSNVSLGPSVSDGVFPGH